MVAIAVDFAAAGSATWQPLTCQVFGLGWSRGATEDRGIMSVPESGQLVAYFIDPERDLDPDNAAGAYAGAIDIGARLRVTAGGVVAFTGRIDQIAHDLNPPPRNAAGMALARIAAVDGVAAAASVEAGSTVGATSWPAETTGARVGHLLDAAALPAAGRVIEAGGQQLQAGGLVNDVWSDLLAVVQNELGSIDFRPDGGVVFRTRASTWTAGTPALHLGCDAHAGALPLDSVRLMSERSTIRNRISAARAGGTAIVVEDAASQARFGLRATQRHDLILLDDASVNAWELFALNRAKLPNRALENVAVSPDDAGVATIEAVPLFTGRVHVYQDNFGAVLDRTYRLLGVGWDIDDTGHATASLTLGTDTTLISTLRRYALETQAQWVAGLGASSGVLGWLVELDALRTSIAGEYSASSGGIDALVITWRADL
jgi:hypothetical protein